MTFTLFAVAIDNPEIGETTILAAAADKEAVQTEIFPELFGAMSSALPQLSVAERPTFIKMLGSMRIITLNATEVTE